MSLGLSDRDVITDDDKLHAIRLLRMLCGILLLGQTEVENISGIIPL